MQSTSNTPESRKIHKCIVCGEDCAEFFKLDGKRAVPCCRRCFMKSDKKQQRDALNAERAKNVAEAQEAMLTEAKGKRAKHLEVPAGRYEIVRHKDDIEGKQFVTQITVINAHEVTPEPIEWLWTDRIPAGHITFAVGKPDNAKSLFTTDLAARISSGADFPDCKNTHGPKRVLMYAGEDPVKQVVIPRLIAAGANLKNIQLLDSKSFKVIDQEGNLIDKREINLASDISTINHLIHDNPDITLMILDPVTGVFGAKNVNKDEDMRPILNELKEMCEKRGLTIVMVAHTNKRSDASAIQQIQGCSSMAALPRAAWLFTSDPESDDKHAHMMSLIKGNLTGKKSGLKLFTFAEEVPGAGQHPKIQWGDGTDMQADDANQALKEKREEKKDRHGGKCEEWLMGFLANGIKRSPEVYKAAQAHGFGDTMVKRALKNIGGRHVGKHPGPFSMTLEPEGEEVAIKPDAIMSVAAGDAL